MNLLIVDDQMMVVQGLLKGVNWSSYGIDNVYGAMSVAGALDIFEKESIDVLLCDIEMPIENGLSLVSWVNRQQLDTKCILLTAHAKFSYAQQSVKLHVFDYVLQPAPYEQIAEVVQRAVRELQQERQDKYFTTYGETVSRSENTIVGAALNNWLCCYGNVGEFERYASFGKLPTQNVRHCVLALIQILRWKVLRDWTPALLAVAFENVASELFAACGYKVAIAPMGEGEYALLGWSEDDEMPVSAISQQMNLFWNICQKHLGSVVALYWSESFQRKLLQEQWKKLLRQKEDNVSRKSDIFFLGDQEEKKSLEPKRAEITFWTQQLAGGCSEAVEKDVLSLLDRMERDNQIDARSLRTLHQDFLQAFYNALGANNESWNNVLSDPATFSIYCDATKSVEHMKRFVHVAVACFAEREEPPEQELLARIDAYIDDHMETEVSRQDLANCVFLNVDYLNRLVRRATGSSLKEYVVRRKLEKARILLRTTRLPVAIVASKVGYINAAHFSVAYKKQFGKTPMQTRNGDAEE